MEQILKRLLMLFLSVFWAFVLFLQAFVMIILTGPKQLFSWSHHDPNAPPPAELQNPSYGAHEYVNIGAVKLHYVVSGPQDAPLMLLLHGFPEMWYSWRYQIKEFQKDFRVIALDMRGYGDSDKPNGVANYKMNLLIEDIRLFINAVDYKSCVLVSHDWGGAVAYAFAAHHPDMVDRLVVMNIPPAPIWRNGFTSLTKPIQFCASGYIYFFMLPYLPEIFVTMQDLRFLYVAFKDKRIGLQSGSLTDEEIECYKHYFRKPGAASAGLNYYRANLGVPGYTHNIKYPMPVQIIWGCKDVALTLTVLSDTLKAIPQAKVTKIENASHWVQMDRPEEVNCAIRDFLRSSEFSM